MKPDAPRRLRTSISPEAMPNRRFAHSSSARRRDGLSALARPCGREFLQRLVRFLLGLAPGRVGMRGPQMNL
ncbi:Hypothetical protein BN69_1941 [Methylocystis sp. SC2]|nr:Hypothetical protein BN69_1941 [Methylocystis sp. SC2]